LTVEIHPRRLQGPWDAGFALDIHTGSTFLGNDQYGRPRFDTKRSPLGELLYRLKYKLDQTTIDPIVETVAAFLGAHHSPIDAIVPVPPSNVRTKQPVTLIANALSRRLAIPVCTTCVSKIRRTPPLKDITEYHKRVEALRGAFRVSREDTHGKSLLLFDDLYGSGATVSGIAEILKREGGAKAVYLLTLTRK